MHNTGAKRLIQRS